MEYIERIFEYGVPVASVQDVKWGDSKRFSTRTNKGRVLGPRRLRGSKILGVVNTGDAVVAHSEVAVKLLDFIAFTGAFNRTATDMFNFGYDVLTLGGANYFRDSSIVYVNSADCMYDFVDNVIVRIRPSSTLYSTLFDAICEACKITETFLFRYDTLVLRHSWNRQLFFELEHTPEANAFFAKVALGM